MAAQQSSSSWTLAFLPSALKDVLAFFPSAHQDVLAFFPSARQDVLAVHLAYSLHEH